MLQVNYLLAYSYGGGGGGGGSQEKYNHVKTRSHCIVSIIDIHTPLAYKIAYTSSKHQSPYYKYSFIVSDTTQWTLKHYNSQNNHCFLSVPRSILATFYWEKKRRSFKAKPKKQAEQENKLCIHNAVIVPIVWESACLSRSFGFSKSFI